MTGARARELFKTGKNGEILLFALLSVFEPQFFLRFYKNKDSQFRPSNVVANAAFLT